MHLKRRYCIHNGMVRVGGFDLKAGRYPLYKLGFCDFGIERLSSGYHKGLCMIAHNIYTPRTKYSLCS